MRNWLKLCELLIDTIVYLNFYEIFFHFFLYHILQMIQNYHTKAIQVNSNETRVNRELK